MPTKFDPLEFGEDISVPRGSGIEGILRTIKAVLQLPRVQYVHVEAGKITYLRHLKPGEEPKPVRVDLESLLPNQVIRRSVRLVEMEVSPELPASTAIAGLFKRVSIAGLYPIEFAVGPSTQLWKWHTATTGVDLSDTPDTLYGVPTVIDETLPDEALFLCAAFTDQASLVDCQYAYKLNIPGIL